MRPTWHYQLAHPAESVEAKMMTLRVYIWLQKRDAELKGSVIKGTKID